MNEEHIVRTAFFLLFFSIFFVRGYYTRKTLHSCEAGPLVNKKIAAREAPLSILLRFLGFICMIGIIIIYAVEPEFLQWAMMHLPLWLRWAGIGLGIMGIALLIWVHHSIGKYWSASLQLREKHKIITIGPYQWVRHPMYTAFLTIFISFWLISSIWLFLLLLVLAAILIYIRIGNEESMMLEQFGDKYRVYMKNTARLFPRFFLKPNRQKC